VSAVPEALPGIVADVPAHERPSDPTGLPRKAQVYLFALGAVTLAAAGDL
jgi:hypothetical protein